MAVPKKFFEPPGRRPAGQRPKRTGARGSASHEQIFLEILEIFKDFSIFYLTFLSFLFTLDFSEYMFFDATENKTRVIIGVACGNFFVDKVNHIGS